MIQRPLSGRQYNMLQALYDNGVSGHMSIDEAQHFDQRPFRSMLIRKYCAYRPNGARGFHITEEGRRAMEDFHTAKITRQNPTLPLTAYFDPTAYGLTSLKVRKKPKAAKAPRGPAPGVRDNVREFLRKGA